MGPSQRDLAVRAREMYFLHGGIISIEMRFTGMLRSYTHSYDTIIWSLRVMENQQFGSKVAVE